MLLAEVEWTQIILAIIGVISIAITGWIAIRQNQINAKVELARLEAARQGRRTNRRVKKLCEDTEVQTTIIKEAKEHIAQVEKQTNGMKDRLVAEAEERALRAADQFAANVAAREAAATPQQVTVVNPEPIPVEITEPPKQ